MKPCIGSVLCLIHLIRPFEGNFFHLPPMHFILPIVGLVKIKNYKKIQLFMEPKKCVFKFLFLVILYFEGQTKLILFKFQSLLNPEPHLTSHLNLRLFPAVGSEQGFEYRGNPFLQPLQIIFGIATSPQSLWTALRVKERRFKEKNKLIPSSKLAWTSKLLGISVRKT